jgi:hypothetical protein
MKYFAHVLQNVSTESMCLGSFKVSVKNSSHRRNHKLGDWQTQHQ